MRSRSFSLLTSLAFALVAPALASTFATAQQFRILHSFRNSSTDGASSFAPLTFDKEGNLYGTTLAAGSFGYGTVFELSPKAGGGYTEKTLHNFNDNGKDGTDAYSGLILDASGHIFGTTLEGGANDMGIVFELIPQTGGGWAEGILYNFAGTSESGAYPFGNLVFDSKGNLYGTAESGGGGTNCTGESSCGAVYELSPQPGGAWTEKVLHSFGVSATDGVSPVGALVLDAKGDLYGVTFSGGVYDNGMAFELIPGTDGNWTEKDLHDFSGGTTDGYDPYTGLVLDKAGNLYGTTAWGGSYGGGIAYELTHTAGGWTEAILHNFGSTNDGAHPYYGPLVVDGVGNLYGTTGSGGVGNLNSGTAFELTPAGAGAWTEAVLITFGGDTPAEAPYGGVILDAHGNLYGATVASGGYGAGAVYEIVP